MDSFPAQSAPAPGRNTAAGEFASAGAILTLTGLCIVLLAFSSLPSHREAGDSGPAMPHMIASTLPPPDLETQLYIVVAREIEAANLRRMLETESQLRTRLGERQRQAEVIAATSESEAAAIAATVNDPPSLHGIATMRAIVVK